MGKQRPFCISYSWACEHNYHDMRREYGKNYPKLKEEKMGDRTLTQLLKYVKNDLNKCKISHSFYIRLN